VQCSDDVVRVELATHEDRGAIGALRTRAATMTARSVLEELHHSSRPATAEADVRPLARNGNLAPYMLDWVHTSAGRVRQPFTPHFGAYTGLAAPRWPAPDPGGDTESVLRAVGYGAAELREMAASGAIKGRSVLFT
jgi:crotonobetainyl-CoA:carnitine CoA-transferase CaiB-like acyl-CoA transferase